MSALRRPSVRIRGNLPSRLGTRYRPPPTLTSSFTTLSHKLLKPDAFEANALGWNEAMAILFNPLHSAMYAVGLVSG